MTKHRTKKPPKEVWVVVDGDGYIYEVYDCFEVAEGRVFGLAEDDIKALGAALPYKIQRYVLPPAELSDTTTKKLSPLEKEAISWWRSHRPVGHTQEQHLEHPTVNAGYTDAAKKLAAAVARLVKARAK